MARESSTSMELATEEEIGRHGYSEWIRVPSPRSRSSLKFAIIGFVLHIFTSIHELGHSPRSATDRRAFPRDECDDHWDVSQYNTACLDFCPLDHCPVK